MTWLASRGALEPVAWILPAFTLMTAAGAPELRVAGALAATAAVWRSLQPGGVRRGAAAFAWSILLSFLVGLLLDMSPVQVAGGSGEYGAVEAPAPFHDPTDPALPLLAPDVPAVEAAPGADFTPPVLRSEADLRRLTAEHYPPHLRERGIAGSADLRFQVLEDGTVNPRTIRVESSTRPGFELPAQELAPALRFHPATQRGRPMAATLVMTIDFRLDP